jgi:hypothetical protein
MKRGLIVGLAVLVVLVVVATVVVTGAIPMGTVILCLDQESYRPDETVTLTIRSLRTGTVQFGTPFVIQRFEDGDWVDVSFGLSWIDMPEGRLAVWTLPLIVLGPGQAYRQSFRPAEHFFEGSKTGKYRVVKEVQVGMIHAGASRKTQVLTAEFRIE